MKGSQKRYEEKNLVQFKFALNKSTDNNLITWLKSPAVPNFRQLVIRLLREEKKIMDYETSAAALFDGGWRSEDKDQMIKEYDLSEEEAFILCKELKKLEYINISEEEVKSKIMEYGLYNYYYHKIKDAYDHIITCTTKEHINNSLPDLLREYAAAIAVLGNKSADVIMCDIHTRNSHPEINLEL